MEQFPQKNNRNGAVQGLKDIYGSNSPYNMLDFIIKMTLNNSVVTATPVKVLAVEGDGSGNPAGYVDVLPLVCSVDAEGNTIEPATLYHIPYNRIQGGKAAVVIDPVPGDIGLCVFCKQDTSNVNADTTTPQPPGSFRSFDMADGFYFGGFLNQAPSIYLELKQDDTLLINAVSGITINGDIVLNGDILANGISLVSHVHGGVQGGGQNTGRPV